MNSYLLLFRDEERRGEAFSPEERQRIIERFNAWSQRLREQDRFQGAGKLADDLGTTVRRRDAALVIDGPFCEAKEAIGGFFCIRAESQDQACEIAKDCPILSYGGSVEVRELEALIPQ